MDTLTNYQRILSDFLEEYARIGYANAAQIEQQVITDLNHNHFQLVSVGWDKHQFVYEVVFHFDIKAGRVWIQQNWTDLKLIPELTRRGIDPADIVVGFAAAPVSV